VVIDEIRIEADDETDRALDDDINELCEGKIQAPRPPLSHAFSFFLPSLHKLINN
jgi:hypothetical protein